MIIMNVYSEDYLNDVVENQGKLFDYVSLLHPDCDMKDFVVQYLQSDTRKMMDEGQAYLLTMNYKELWDYFQKNDKYTLKKGQTIEGFLPEWMGEFYAYYQWYYGLPSEELVKKIPIDFLKKVYPGLHDLELDLAVKKVGKIL